MRLLIVGVLLVACSNNSEERDVVKHTDEMLVLRELKKPTPPDERECFAQRLRLRQAARRVYGAKDYFGAKDVAIASARGTSPACRTGSWYLSISLLLDIDIKLDLPGLAFRTAEEALVAALQQPDDVNVLRRVAQASALGHDISLPPDACERARAVAGSDYEGKDAAHYVCARVAIADGRGTQAIRELDAVVVPGLMGDFELARAQAAQLAGDRVAKVRHARAAIAINRRYFYLSTEDRNTIDRLARSLAR